MNRVQILAAMTIILAVVCGVLTLALPVPVNSSRSALGFYVNMSAAFMIAILHVGAAIIFIKGLRDFTHRLKIAYGIFCVGLAFFGLAQLQLPVIVLLDAFDSFWVQSGLITVPYLVPVLALFWGVKSFAKLFEVKTVLTSFWFVFVTSVALVVLSSFLPHAYVSLTEQEFNGAVGLNVWGGAFITAAAITTLQVKRSAGALYSNSLAWVFVALLAIAIENFNYLVPLHVVGDQHWYVRDGPSLIPYVFIGLCWLRAAYAFNTLSEQEAVVARASAFTFFGKPRLFKENTQTTPIDIVTYAAQLVSNQDAIEASLEKVRAVTAMLAPGQSLSSDQIHTLQTAYLEIEAYLTTNEPVRRLTKEALRQNIKDKLQMTDITFFATGSTATPASVQKA